MSAMSAMTVISDNSYKSLSEVPSEILELVNLKMLYLDGNSIQALPENLFQKLPKLYWLDLRSNKLKTIPTGIAHHKCLENILLQNNQIEKLPNELGLLPHLKVLQVSGNPLKYPAENIVDRGVDDICIYLKQEYYKTHTPPNKPEIPQSLVVIRPEKYGKPTPRSLTASTPEVHSSGVYNTSATTITSNSEMLKSYNSTSCSLKVESLPVMSIESLNERVSQKKLQHKQSICRKERKTHSISKGPARIAVRSHYNIEKYMRVRDGEAQEVRVQENNLKDLWLEKLKDIIRDQEKIIQREKTLDAMKLWHREKRAELPRKGPKVITKAPFDTDAVYNRFMSRKDMTLAIERMIAGRNGRSKEVDVDKMVMEVIAQMKELERKSVEGGHGEGLAGAQKEIELIADLHKKISELQQANDASIT